MRAERGEFFAVKFGVEFPTAHAVQAADDARLEKREQLNRILRLRQRQGVFHEIPKILHRPHVDPDHVAAFDPFAVRLGGDGALNRGGAAFGQAIRIRVRRIKGGLERRGSYAGAHNRQRLFARKAQRLFGKQIRHERYFAALIGIEAALTQRRIAPAIQKFLIHCWNHCVNA